MNYQTNSTSKIAPLELWGGVECTVNRVGNKYFDQLELNGHAHRLTDLELFADIGFKALRYPVLWERVAPRGLADADWSWADERLTRLRQLNIRAIVGLTHHGSGTPDTNLLADDYPTKLALYAARCAARYPWIEDYTPVNEPLTTARFSGLYGYWYPHAKDDLSFARMLINECRATVLAMREIRQVNPNARLIQTEDLGKVWSTPRLQQQAEFENERRWLTFDLLCGRVDKHHALWNYLLAIGIQEKQLAFFLDNPCPPDVLGINYYATSERFLDERIARYPKRLHGGNHSQRYADTEAVRVCAEGIAGAGARLREAAQRYDLPLAITEAHLGCTREEQMRWFMEVWREATELKATGTDVRAVTAWALLGTYNWNSLVTRQSNYYESGAFDVRSGVPRPTALATMLKSLAREQQFHHPTLAAAGWWRKLDRLIYPPVARRPNHEAIPSESTARSSRLISMDAHKPLNSQHFGDGGNTSTTYSTSSGEGLPFSKEDKGMNKLYSPPSVLITGATGTLGQAFARICRERGIVYHLTTRGELDITNEDSIAGVLDKVKPWAIINTAGYVRVDDAEREVEKCQRENATAVQLLARAAAKRQIKFVTFSSDLVFDGKQREPYVESDKVAPLNVYGESKAAAERFALTETEDALVIRTSAFFGLWDTYNFAYAALDALSQHQIFTAISDHTVSPTFVPDLVHTTLDLLIDEARGLYHIANPCALTWAEWAVRCAEFLGVNSGLVEGVPASTLDLPAARPAYSVLASEHHLRLPDFDTAWHRFLRDAEIARQAKERVRQPSARVAAG